MLIKITVPTVWPDTTQSKTRQCAEQAGMGQGSALHIISEPEATPMYALDIMDPRNIKLAIHSFFAMQAAAPWI